jgi:hypothetical protein
MRLQKYAYICKTGETPILRDSSLDVQTALEAFLAADDKGVIEMVHLIRAMRREYQKMGQILRGKDLGQYVDLR